MMNLRSCGLAAILALFLSACADGDSTPLSALITDGADAPGASADALSVDGVDATDAPLLWRPCGQFDDRNLECAEVMVPVDYAEPDADRLAIALRRVRANPLEPYHGALLFNPGGPGGPGIESALSLFEAHLFDVIAPGYDVVGFDPRGVANSGEVGCGVPAENLYPGAISNSAPVRTIADYVAKYKATGERCEQQWGPLFRKLGSNNVVRDMEQIRKALNEPVLNFLGGSYGTRLGALYAHEFPETSGRIVLDASVHPRASLVRSMRAKLSQTVTLHEQLLASCASGELECPPDATALFEGALANARQHGVELEFTGSWAALLKSRAEVDILLKVLAAQAADPTGDWIADFAADEGDNGVVFNGVSCSDDTLEPPTLAELESLQAEFHQLSPVFAEFFVQNAAACAGWPATRDPVPLPTAFDAPPLLVIGGTADSRTPYEWSQAMTETLGNATLLTSNHYGHGALIEGGECVLLTVRAYLTSGSLPASGALCP